MSLRSSRLIEGQNRTNTQQQLVRFQVMTKGLNFMIEKAILAEYLSEGNSS